MQFLCQGLLASANLDPDLLNFSLVVLPDKKFVVWLYTSIPIGKNARIPITPTITAIKIEKEYGISSESSDSLPYK